MCVSNLKLELKLLARKCRVSKHENFGEVFCGVLQASLVTVGSYDGLPIIDLFEKCLSEL